MWKRKESIRISLYHIILVIDFFYKPLLVLLDIDCYRYHCELVGYMTVEGKCFHLLFSLASIMIIYFSCFTSDIFINYNTFYGYALVYMCS